MSETKRVSIDKLKPNPDNPRVIKDDKFKKLVQSIKDFPEMLKLRPIVVDKDMVVLGGNMRLRALKDAGVKDVEVIIADNLTDDQKREFIIKDNVGFGEWNWETLANEWDAEQLGEWGLDVWTPPADVDYSILDDEGSAEERLEQMEDTITKQLKIEVSISDYKKGLDLVKFWKERSAYVGGMIIDYLKSEKEKL